MHIYDQLADTTPYLTTLRAWFEAQWGEIDPFIGLHPEVVVPAPVVAVNDSRELVGGLAFANAQAPRRNNDPDSTEIVVWVNALLVAPEFRSRGIGTRLIEAAQATAAAHGLAELFVLSDVPQLYRRLGWTDVLTTAAEARSDGEIVLTRTLAE